MKEEDRRREEREGMKEEDRRREEREGMKEEDRRREEREGMKEEDGGEKGQEGMEKEGEKWEVRSVLFFHPFSLLPPSPLRPLPSSLLSPPFFLVPFSPPFSSFILPPPCPFLHPPSSHVPYLLRPLIFLHPTHLWEWGLSNPQTLYVRSSTECCLLTYSDRVG